MPPGLLNSIVKAILFPRPTPATYGPAEPLPDRLLYIPLVEPEAPHRESGNHTFAYLLHHAANTHLLIYAHPNAVDLGLVVGELEVVSQRAKVSVLLFEYSGYGLTDTDITERSINTDMLSAYYFARRHLMVPPEKMLVCGRSIGAAPAAHLCANLPTDASPALLILQCPFASLSDCIHELSGQALTPIANFLGYDLFRTIDLIADVRCPVALHHGTHDATIPIKSSYQLQQRRDEAERPCVTYLYPDHGQGHNNLRTSTLVDIIRERKDDGDLHELHLTWPAHLVAHPSVHPHLFSHRSGELIAGLSELAAAWRRRLHIRQYLFSRDNLHLLLTASVCWFSVHCTRAWQIYSRLHHENVCGEDGRRDRCTKQVFVRRCIACWGSPVGIGVPEPTSGNQVAAVVFGCAVAPHRIRYFDTSATFMSCHELPPLMPIYEMPVSDGLVHAIKRVITAAPSLIDDVDAQHLSAAPDLVDAIQGECERLVGFLPSERWEALQMLLANFESQSSDVVSARASSFLRSWRLQERDEAEHTDEDPCQLHSWGDVLQPDGDVPLDCRLYAARCLAHRLPLCPQMDWRECRRSIEEAGMAATIYERCQRAMMQPSVEAD